MRRSIVAVLAAGLSLALAACGSTTTSTPTTSGPAASGTLTVWVDETRVEGFKELAAQFQAQSGVSLDVVQKPTADIKTDFIAQAPTGEGPDLIVGAHDWLGDLTSNGVVASVELGDAVNGLSDTSKAAFTSNGQLYGVPYAIENIALVRNNAIVQSTPATFDELVAQGKATGKQFPVLIQQGTSGDAYHLYPLQTSFGAPVLKANASGEYTSELGMAGPEGIAFAQYLKKLAGEGALSANLGADQAKQAFLDGNSPYIVTGPWATADFTKAGIDISVLPIPSAGGQVSAAFLGVQGVYLSSHSTNTLLANQFLDYVASDAVQTKLYELGGRTPASTAAAAAVSDEILAGFTAAGKDGQPMPAIPAMTAVWNYWGATEVNIISGQASDPAAAWNEMIANIKASL